MTDTVAPLGPGPAEFSGHERRADAAAAIRRARSLFMAAERIDMQQLSTDMGVDRSTLFRWVGNRDELLVTILRSLADPTLEAAAAIATGTGGSRLARTAGIYAQLLIDTPYYRAFMQREPERALRIITTKASPLQRHVVATFQRLIQQAIDRGELVHSLKPYDLAYLIVRVIESFVYADLITGDPADATKVEEAVAALLHSKVQSRGRSLASQVRKIQEKVRH